MIVVMPFTTGESFARDYGDCVLMISHARHIKLTSNPSLCLSSWANQPNDQNIYSDLCSNIDDVTQMLQFWVRTFR
jgi:hypothetical protein